MARSKTGRQRPRGSCTAPWRPSKPPARTPVPAAAANSRAPARMPWPGCRPSSPTPTNLRIRRGPRLERLVVQQMQALPDNFVKLSQAEKRLIANRRQNERGDRPHRSLDRGFVLRRTHSRWDDRRAVVLRQLLIRFVKHKLSPGIFDHACFEIIRHKNSCRAAEKGKGVHVRGGPRLLVLRPERLGVGVATVRQRGHEHIRVKGFARVRAHHMRRLPCPVHFHEFAGLAVDVHGRLSFQHVVPVVFLELRELVRQQPLVAAFVAVLHPQQMQRHAWLGHFPVHPVVVRHGVHGRALALGEQLECQFLVAQALRTSPVQPLRRRALQDRNHGRPGDRRAFGDPAVVDPQAAQPQDLSVVGHSQ